MTDLLPCPFCGSQPVTERTGFSLRAMYIYCINDNGCPRPKAIGESEEKAIENWNTRYSQAGSKPPKVRTSHHRNKEEAARLQALVNERYASSPPKSAMEVNPSELMGEIERLRRLLNSRDDFIVNKGLWSEFTDSLSRESRGGAA